MSTRYASATNYSRDGEIIYPEGPMPPEVRRLIDSHGAGIPHYSSSGDYLINVYPELEYETRRAWWGGEKKELIGSHKLVTIINRKTGDVWQAKSYRSGG